MMKERHFVYILRCADGTYYTGWTTDPARRLKAHNAGKAGGGAKYTAPEGRRPVTIAYQEEFDNKGDALRRETAIKKLTRRQKEKLISQSPSPLTGANEKAIMP